MVVSKVSFRKWLPFHSNFAYKLHLLWHNVQLGCLQFAILVYSCQKVFTILQLASSRKMCSEVRATKMLQKPKIPINFRQSKIRIQSSMSRTALTPPQSFVTRWQNADAEWQHHRFIDILCFRDLYIRSSFHSRLKTTHSSNSRA